MTIVRKYPTVLGANPGGWLVPSNVLNTEDNLCTSLAVTVNGDYILNFSTYGFAIPAGATIIRETLKLKSAYHDNNSSPVSGIFVNLHYGINLYIWGPADYGGNPTCLNTSFYGFDLSSLISIADLNAENFTTWIDLYLGHSTGFQLLGRCDAVFIEVEYTMPPTGFLRRLLVGEGL